MESKYIFAASKQWCLDEYDKAFGKSENWYLVTKKEQLTLELIKKIRPKYIFFPHWNWIVPQDVTDKYECVCFHMTDVPYGRGGSPLQNLIARGHKKTKLTALKMVKELDAGPVYGKLGLSLEGSATEIFNRAAPKVMELINIIISGNPKPKEQTGEIVKFERRTPNQSEINSSMTASTLYDHIRMLDAEGYPNAFIDIGDLRFEFDRVNIDANETLSAKVLIRQRKDVK